MISKNFRKRTPMVESLDQRAVPTLLGGLGVIAAEVAPIVKDLATDTTIGDLVTQPIIENDSLLGDISNGISDALPITLFGEPDPRA